MATGQNIREFKTLLQEKAKDQVAVQTHWCSVKLVDWQKRTMTATGLTDGLDFYEVLLGIGSVHTKPKPGTKCLIGLIKNNAGNAFLIWAEEIEEMVITSGESGFTIKEEGFIMKGESENLRGLLLDLITTIREMVFTTNNGPTINLVNDPQFAALGPRFKSLLKDS